MPSFSFSRRSPRRSLLIEINPFQILAADLRRTREGPVRINRMAEFAAEDNRGLRGWLDATFGEHRTWIPTVCSIVPPEGLLHRESLLPHKLAEPDYLPNLVRDQYKIENPEAWKLSTLSPLEGMPLPAEGTQRPALVCGVSHSNVRQVQQRLLDHRLLPYRLELSILPLIGAITDYTNRRNDKRAVVVVVIEQDHTTAYILGKEGVHTPAPVRHGFSSIVQNARKEFGLTTAEEVCGCLQHIDEELLLRATRFVRAIGRDLKPLVDSYEMTTGQPVGEIHCAYLPSALAWITEPLAQVVGRTPFSIDCPEWLSTANLQLAEEAPLFDRHWLGAFSLVADLPRPKLDGLPREGSPKQGPWHIDCRLSARLPSNNFISPRFMSATIAVTLLAFTLALAFWQWHVISSLDTDTDFWNRQMAANQRLFDKLTEATRSLGSQSARFDHASDLMGMPYQVTDFILNLGRSLPPHMRVDRIEADGNRVAMSGGLREPPEQASRTLGRYMDELRQAPAFGPLFSSIGLTSLQRENGPDESLGFEITFRLKEGTP